MLGSKWVNKFFWFWKRIFDFVKFLFFWDFNGFWNFSVVIFLVWYVLLKCVIYFIFLFYFKNKVYRLKYLMYVLFLFCFIRFLLIDMDGFLVLGINFILIVERFRG